MFLYTVYKAFRDDRRIHKAEEKETKRQCRLTNGRGAFGFRTVLWTGHDTNSIHKTPEEAYDYYVEGLKKDHENARAQVVMLNERLDEAARMKEEWINEHKGDTSTT